MQPISLEFHPITCLGMFYIFCVSGNKLNLCKRSKLIIIFWIPFDHFWNKQDFWDIWAQKISCIDSKIKLVWIPKDNIKLIKINSEAKNAANNIMQKTWDKFFFDSHNNIKIIIVRKKSVYRRLQSLLKFNLSFLLCNQPFIQWFSTVVKNGPLAIFLSYLKYSPYI